jgi:general L-amino acid transport system permease protein
MLNQSGRVVEIFLIIMATYLAISLTISFIMNIVNRRIQIVER